MALKHRSRAVVKDHQYLTGQRTILGSNKSLGPPALHELGCVYPTAEWRASGNYHPGSSTGPFFHLTTNAL